MQYVKVLKMKDKFLYWEDKIFTAPYKWLIKKGLIVVEKVYLTMTDLYEKKFLEEYRGNPNWAGDD